MHILGNGLGQGIMGGSFKGLVLGYDFRRRAEGQRIKQIIPDNTVWWISLLNILRTPYCLTNSMITPL